MSIKPKTIKTNEIGYEIHSSVIDNKTIELEVKNGKETNVLTLRKKIFYDRENKREFEFLINVMDIRPDMIAAFIQNSLATLKDSLISK